MSEFLKRSDNLALSIIKLRENPFSPDVNTNFWRAKLQADGKRIGLEIKVIKCDWREDEIREPMIDIKGNKVDSMMVYVPQELMGKEGLKRLGQMYPKMNDWSVSVQEEIIIQDSPDANKEGGWIKVEATIDAPNLNTTQGDLKRHAEKQKYSGQRENVYILASQASKNLTGHYLDEGPTQSRLLGSRSGNFVIVVRFSSVGGLIVGWILDPQDQDHHVDLGGRFEKVKKV